MVDFSKKKAMNPTQGLQDATGVTDLHRAAQQGNISQAKVLLDNCKVDLLDSKGQTPLFYACSKGNLEMVKLLVEYKADTIIFDNQGRTPHMIAAQVGHKEIVENLYYVSLQADKFGRTIIHYACVGGNVELLKYIIASVKADTQYYVNFKDSNGRTPLFYACSSQNFEIVLALVSEFQADPAIQDNVGCTAVMIAAQIGHKGIVEALNYVSLHADNFGQTIVHYACAGGNVDLLKYILASIEANVHDAINLKDSSGWTPLFHACQAGQVEMVVALVSEFKANPLIQNSDGCTATMIAAQSGNTRTLEALNYYALHADKFGRTALHYACEGGNVEVIENLLTHGADINKPDAQDHTPLQVAVLNDQIALAEKMIREHVTGTTLLHTACSVGNIGIVRDCLEKESKAISSYDCDKNTPLHVAALWGQKEVVAIIMNEYKGDVNVKGHLGRTPLHVACCEGEVSLVRNLISKYKADFNAQDDRNNTPLHVAALMGKRNIVIALINNFKCDPVVRGYQDRSLLHSACIGGSLYLVREICKYISPLEVDSNGNTPHHTAALNGKKEIVFALIEEFECDPAVKGYQGRSLLHSACIGGNADLVGKLCKHISPLEVDSNGDTPLHTAAALGYSKCVEVLLSHGAPLLVRDNSGRTSLDVAIAETRVFLDAYLLKNRSQIYEEYDAVQALAKKKYSRPERITRIFVIGNPGVGKSTLIETLKREGRFDYFRTVSEASVPPHTAGIIPSIHMSKYCGRILFYDFAGDPEYYSSHAAILETLTISKKSFNIFAIVVDLREENVSIQRIMNYWTLFIHNQNFEKSKVLFIAIGSHLDTLSRRIKLQKCQEFRSVCEKIKVIEGFELSCFMLNCCRPQSSEVINIQKKTISATKDSPRYQLSLQASILLGLLEKDFSHVISCPIQDILSHIKDTGIDLPKEEESFLPVLSELQDIGLLLAISANTEEVQIVLQVSTLTHEVHRLLFSKQALDRLVSSNSEEDVSNSSFNIGIIPEELLFGKGVFSQSNNIVPLPKFITKECLIQLQYCQEIHHEDIQAFLPAPSDSSRSYLFFPALCTAQKHTIALWTNPPDVKYSQGWLALCTDQNDYFPPRFLHVLLLRLVFKFTLSSKASASLPDHSVFQRRCCRMWSIGVFWSMRQGVKCIVELVKDSKAVVVFVRSDNESSNNFTKVFNEIISCVKKTQSDFCHHIKPEYFLLDSTEESDLFDQSHMFRMTDVEQVLKNPKDMEVIFNIAETTEMKVSRLQMLFTQQDQVPDEMSCDADDQEKGPSNQDQESSPSPSALHQGSEVKEQASYNSITPHQDFFASSTCHDFASYVSSLPPAARPHLEYQLDWDNDYDRDLCELAHHMLGWDVELSTHLCLSKVDIHDIKEDNSKAELRRRAALELWKNRQMQSATYGNLLQVFVDAGHSECAEALCQLLKSKYEEANSDACKLKNPK